MEHKVYVGNLPRSISEEEVKNFFTSCGEIENLALIKDRITQELRGFGFITFSSQAAMQNAIALSGKELGGRKLTINQAQERTGRSSGGQSRNRNGWGKKSY